MLNQLKAIQNAKTTWDTKTAIVDNTKKAIIDKLQNKLQEATQDIVDVSKTTSDLIKNLSTPLEIDNALQKTLTDSVNHLATMKSSIQAQKSATEAHISAYDDGQGIFSDKHIQDEITKQNKYIESINNANTTLLNNYNSGSKKGNAPKLDFSGITPFAEKITNLKDSIKIEQQNFKQGKEYIEYVNKNIKTIEKAISELKKIQGAVNQFEPIPTANRIEINTDDDTSTINLEKGIKSGFALGSKQLSLSDPTGSINAQYPDPDVPNSWRIRTNATLKDGSNKDIIVTITTTDKHDLSAIKLSDIRVFDPSIRNSNGELQELSKDLYPIEFGFNISTSADIKIGSKKLTVQNITSIPMRLTCESLDAHGKKSAIHNELADTNKQTHTHLNTLLSRSIQADDTTADHIESATDRYFKDASGNIVERKGLFDKKLLTGFIAQHLKDESGGSHGLVDRIATLITTTDFKKNPLLYSATDTSHSLDNRLSHMGNKLPGYTGGGTGTFREKFAQYIDDLNNGTHISDPVWTSFFASDAVWDMILTGLASSTNTFELKRSWENNPQTGNFLDHYHAFTNYVNNDYPTVENLHNITISDAYSEHLMKLAQPLTTSMSGTLADGKKYTMKLISAYDTTSKTYNAKVEVLIDKTIVGNPSPYEITNAYNYKDIMRGIHDLCSDIEDKRGDKSLKSYAGHLNSVGTQLCLHTLANCIGVGPSEQDFTNTNGTISGKIQLLKNASDPSNMEIKLSGSHTFETSTDKKIKASEINGIMQSLDVLLATRRLAQRESIEGTNTTKPMLIPDAMKENITPITDNYSIFVNKYGEGTWIRKTANPDEYECRDTRKRPAQRGPFRTGEWMEGRANVAQSHEDATATHQPLLQQGKATRDHWVYDFKELGQSFIDGFKSVKSLAYKAPLNTLKSLKGMISGNKSPSTIEGVEEQVSDIASIGSLHDSKTVRYDYINAVSPNLKDTMTNLYLNNNERTIGKFVYDLKGIILKSHGDETLAKKKLKNILSERTGYTDLDVKTDELYTILTDITNDPEYISSQLQEIVINGITASSDCKDFVQSKSNTIATLLRNTRGKNEKRTSELRGIFNTMVMKNTRGKGVGYAWSFFWLQTVNIISTVKAVTETGKLAGRTLDTTYKHTKTGLKTAEQLIDGGHRLVGSKTLGRESANDQYTISKLLQTMPPEAKTEFETMNIHSTPDREYHILQQGFNAQRSYLADQWEDTTKELNKEYYYSGDLEKLHEGGIAINITINNHPTTFAMQRDTSGAMTLHRLDGNIGNFQNAKNIGDTHNNTLKSFIRNLKVTENSLYTGTDGDQTTTNNVEKSRDTQITNLQDLPTLGKCKISEALLNQQDYERKTHNPSIIQSTLRIDANGTLSGDQEFIDLYKNDRRIISGMSEAINYFYPANTNRDIVNTFRRGDRADSTLSEKWSSIRNFTTRAFSKKTFKFGKKL